MRETPRNGPAARVVPDREIGEVENPVAEIAQEIATYRSRLPELLAHEGEFVLIKGDRVIGFFEDSSAALREGPPVRPRPAPGEKIAAVEPSDLHPQRGALNRCRDWKCPSARTAR